MRIEFKVGKKKVYLISDKDNLIVADNIKKVKDTKTGKERDHIVKPRYYSQMKYAIQELFERQIKESDATTLEELVNDIKNIKREIYDKFEIILPD